MMILMLKNKDSLRKSELQLQISVDGFIAGPNSEMEWLVWDWDDKPKEYVNELTESIDTILLGRKMTEGFISHWSDMMSKPDHPDYAFATNVFIYKLRRFADLIQELPEVPDNKTTEVLYGVENAVRRGVQFMQNAKKKMDLCGDKNGPSIIMEFEVYKNNYIDVKRRGGKIRLITDITKENINYCKELMKIVDELRHLDEIKGGIAISESEYMGTLTLKEKQLLSQVIYSNVREVVEQQQYIFNSLWSKAIPARQRIKEIEKGTKREFAETILEPKEIQQIFYELLKAATHEVLILFSTTYIFQVQQQERLFESVKEAIAHGANVRILIPHDDQITQSVQQLLIRDSQINIRFIRDPLPSHLSTVIVDEALSLAFESEKDQDNNAVYAEGNSLDTMGATLAVYSNNESLALTYASIFEKLWIQNEMHATTKTTNQPNNKQ
jgi:two-component system sensor histidine kinase VicK